MKKAFIKLSLIHALYFSFATLLTFGTANYLYSILNKTPGRLNPGVLLVIVLSLILIMFSISVTNILLSENYRSKKKDIVRDRFLGLLVFIIVSLILIGILGLVLFIPL